MKKLIFNNIFLDKKIINRSPRYVKISRVGKTKISGLYLNTGQGHLGWTLAMGSADLCSDIVLENKTAIDPHPYRITR